MDDLGSELCYIRELVAADGCPRAGHPRQSKSKRFVISPHREFTAFQMMYEVTYACENAL